MVKCRKEQDSDRWNKNSTSQLFAATKTAARLRAFIVQFKFGKQRSWWMANKICEFQCITCSIETATSVDNLMNEASFRPLLQTGTPDKMKRKSRSYCKQ